MKQQTLNRSFGRTLAAVAIALMISSAAQAQQGQWGRDGCLYVPVYGQMVRQGCAFQVAGGHRFYQNYGTKVWTDLNTGISYFHIPVLVPHPLTHWTAGVISLHASESS